MCGRTSLFVPVAELEAFFDAEAVAEIVPRYNIAPGDDLATIPNDRPDEIDAFEWGLLPSRIDDPDEGPRPINARAETVAEKPYFRGAFEARRCLVLADGFYEWAGERGSKEPYRVERVDDDPFAFAGLWETWGESGDVLRTVTILTTDANDVVAPIHDRMPVMLESDEHAAWLESSDRDELRSLLDPFPADLTDAYPVSTAVNDPSNDSPAVVEPLGHDQSGLGQFS